MKILFGDTIGVLCAPNKYAGETTTEKTGWLDPQSNVFFDVLKMSVATDSCKKCATCIYFNLWATVYCIGVVCHRCFSIVKACS